MKLELIQEPESKHSDSVVALLWASNSELYSFSDDQKIMKWSGDGDFKGPLTTSLFDKASKASGNPVSFYVTCAQCLPGTSAISKGGSSSDLFALGGSDGRIYFLARTGKVEKIVEGHKGAVITVEWSHDGSALASGGEDGCIKIWSRSGQLRSTLATSPNPIYSLAWSPENDQVIYTNGRQIVIKPLQPSVKPKTWKAHDALVLKVDWNVVNSLIISGGEDRKYRVWDVYGRQLYSSPTHEHPIMALSWSPGGSTFAVGSYNLLRMCDKKGWTYAMSKPECGSIYDIEWTPDGTQIACASGSGAVLFGHLTYRRLEHKNYDATIVEDKKILVTEVTQNMTEKLDFRDRIIRTALGHGHLIVTTSTQCFIYNEKAWNTPVIFDLTSGGRVTCLKMSAKYFVLIDNITGVHVVGYDGKIASSPKYPGLRAELIVSSAISISPDALAIRDRVDEKLIYLFDNQTGKTLTDEPVKHVCEIIEVALCPNYMQVGLQLTILDKNRDLFLVVPSRGVFKKLGNLVSSFVWHDEFDLLAALSDGKLIVWWYPNTIFVDEDIVTRTRSEKDISSLGSDISLLNFTGIQCTARNGEGAILHLPNQSPFPGMLQELIRKKNWEQAIRLCRFSKSRELWASLAAMAVYGQELNTAELAYAEIDEIQKVQYICYIKDVPTPEGRAAELAVLRHQPKEAESILIAASQYYRAIKIWIDLYNWDRALELAVKYKTHVDTVLYFRQKWLAVLGKPEKNKNFLNLAGLSIDPEQILAKMAVEEGRAS